MRTSLINRAVTTAAALTVAVAGGTAGATAATAAVAETSRGPVVLVSASGTGQPAGNSYSTSINANGRYVVFESSAGNVVPGDTNNASDVFVRDRWTATTSRANLSSAGEQTPPDGDENAGPSGGGSISADGRYVAFHSRARNLVPVNTGGVSSVFVRDRWAGTTRLVSAAGDGTPMEFDSLEPAISGNGRYVVFSHVVNGVADVHRYDLHTATVRRIPAATTWPQTDAGGPRPAISADGRYVAFTSDAATLTPGDTNGVPDVFVHDFGSGTHRRVSRSATGGQTTMDSYTGAISADGRYVVFASADPTLVPGDTNGQTDVFVHDQRARSTRLASVSSAGVQGNAMSYAWMTVSGDGRYVGFGSAADNLVPGDVNGYLDVFVHDRRTATTVRVSEPNQGGQANEESLAVVISADGRQVGFASCAGNLLGEGLPTGSQNVYARPMP
jgi:Tol biopolymer transport system component